MFKHFIQTTLNVLKYTHIKLKHWMTILCIFVVFLLLEIYKTFYYLKIVLRIYI